MMKLYKLFNSTCSISFSGWSLLSWVYEDKWLCGLDYIVCCSYTLFYLGYYNIGLNLIAIMLVVYSIVQVLDLNVVSALISGVASIGHIILSVSLILILLDIKKGCIKWMFRWIFNPSFFWYYHIILILALLKVVIIIHVFSFLNFFLFQSSDYGILLK